MSFVFGGGWPLFFVFAIVVILAPHNTIREQEGVKWPAGLKRLVFGANFKQKVEAADWPDSLEEVTFGTYFNQPVEGMKKW